jgi:fatty-acyl-CoA synthase
MDYALLIGQMLKTGLQAAPGQRITYGTEVEISYAEFGQRVHRLGSALAELGLGQGSVVAVMDYDSHRYLECFFAIPMLGATLHTVNVRLSPAQILYTINHAEDDAILVHQDFLPLLLPLLPNVTRPLRLILLADKPASLPEGFVGDYEALLAAGDAAHVFPSFPETTRATLFYTTGTTGDPKGVTYSHRQLVLHSFGVIACLAPVPGRGGVKSDDVYMPLTPLFHVHGWGFPLIATMLGMRQVYPGRYEPVKLLHLIASHGVTFSHCVPTILAMILAAPEAEAVNLSAWKVLIGGSALPEGLARAALARGIDVNVGYGMSETCPILTVSDMVAAQGSGDTTQVRIATGRAAPLVELRLVDPDMNDVPHDGQSTGEVVARAPWLTHGYLRNPAGTDALWRGGWLHTGDVGLLDAEGYLHLKDRSKDLINSGGSNIYPREVEEVLLTHLGVREVSVIGRPDREWGEAVVAYVVGEANPAELDALCLSHIARFKRPKDYVFVDALPKNNYGKILKTELRAKDSELTARKTSP